MVDISSKSFRFSTKSLKELHLLDSDPDLRGLLPYLALLVRYKCTVCDFTSDILPDISSHIKHDHLSNETSNAVFRQSSARKQSMQNEDANHKAVVEPSAEVQQLNSQRSKKNVISKSGKVNVQITTARKSERLSEKPRKVHSLSTRPRKIPIPAHNTESKGEKITQADDGKSPDSNKGIETVKTTEEEGMEGQPKTVHLSVEQGESVNTSPEGDKIAEIQGVKNENSSAKENRSVVQDEVTKRDEEDMVIEDGSDSPPINPVDRPNISPQNDNLEDINEDMCADIKEEPDSENDYQESLDELAYDIEHDENNVEKKSQVLSSREADRRERAELRRIEQDFKIRTCAVCSEVSDNISDVYAHYKGVHGLVPRSVRHNTPQKYDETGKHGKVGKTVNNSEPCLYCGKIFKKSIMDRHIILRHIWMPITKIQAQKKHVLCDICGKVFKYSHNLLTHKQRHKGIIPKREREPRKKVRRTLICEICGFTTYESRRLQDHISFAHHQEFPYKCTHCNFKTWERCSFRGHMFRHQAEKRYSCSMCSYQCIQRPSLRSHMRRMHGVDLPKAGRHLDYWKQKKQEALFEDGVKPATKMVMATSDKPVPKQKVGETTGENMDGSVAFEGAETYIVQPGKSVASILPESYQLEVINEAVDSLAEYAQLEAINSEDGELGSDNVEAPQAYIIQNADGTSFMIPVSDLEFHVVSGPDDIAEVENEEQQIQISSEQKIVPTSSSETGNSDGEALHAIVLEGAELEQVELDVANTLIHNQADISMIRSEQIDEIQTVVSEEGQALHIVNT